MADLRSNAWRAGLISTLTVGVLAFPNASLNTSLAAAPQSATANSSGYNCVAAKSQPSTPSPLCGPGQVPQPTASDLPKGDIAETQAGPMFAGPNVKHKQPPTNNCIEELGFNYCYASAMAQQSGSAISANLTQSSPNVAPGDSHSLGELSAISSDFQQIVEVGWIVNINDPQPRLFVYHWVNGQGTCYDGCGWVQESTSSVPGMAVTVGKKPQEYGIEHSNGAWRVSYQNQEIGYFPDSIWNGTYTEMGMAEWFGEVSASSDHTLPCTDMGTGAMATKKQRAAAFSNILMDGQTPALSNYQSDTAMYKGVIKGGKYYFGGPGSC